MDSSEAPGVTSATPLLSGVELKESRCRVELPHFATDYLFWPLQQHLEGSRSINDRRARMAVRERFRNREPDFYRYGKFNLAPKWEKLINLLGNDPER